MNRHLPISLIAFRVLMALVIPALVHALGDASRPAVLVLMYLGLISDILDGILARQYGVASARLRRLDSQADMVFWVSIGISTWMLYPDLIRQHAAPISVIFIMEGLCYLISIVKFRRETCTHAFLSKMWGLSLLVTFTFLVGFNHAGIPVDVAIVLGVVSHVDRMLITLILPRWTHDIPSFYHAWLIRKGVAFKRYRLLN